MKNHDEALLTERLILEAQGGDARALEQLLRLYRPRLMRLASSFVRDVDAAEDVLQETMIRLTHSIDRLSTPASFWSWASTILRREAIRHFRSSERNPAAGAGTDAAHLDDRLADSAQSYFASSEMEQCLRRLPTRDRKLLALHYWFGLEIGEIAALLDIAAGAVKTRLFRARNRLRDELCEPDLTPAVQR